MRAQLPWDTQNFYSISISECGLQQIEISMMAAIACHVILFCLKMAADRQKMIYGIRDIFPHVNSAIYDANTIWVLR